MPQLRILVIGAHPDDPDFTTGGVASLYSQAGHKVRYISVTDGSAGHQTMGGAALARARYAETQAVARVAGLEYIVMDNPDAHLEPDVRTREKLTREIRLFSPDVIFTHRPNDYHPDHRITSVLVQDCSFLLTVPNFCRSTPAMRDMPAIFYTYDNFQKPAPFHADVVVDVSSQLENKYRMIHCHTSQVYDWLRYLDHTLDQVPADEETRFKLLHEAYAPRMAVQANQYRAELIAKYGEARGKAVTCCEAFERCEYGRQLSDEEIKEFFPF